MRVSTQMTRHLAALRESLPPLTSAWLSLIIRTLRGRWRVVMGEGRRGREGEGGGGGRQGEEGKGPQKGRKGQTPSPPSIFLSAETRKRTHGQSWPEKRATPLHILGGREQWPEERDLVAQMKKRAIGQSAKTRERTNGQKWPEERARSSIFWAEGRSGRRK